MILKIRNVMQPTAGKIHIIPASLLQACNKTKCIKR